MIISASRRTDIPAHYSDWFMNRLREGYVLIRNPRNAHQVSRVALTPDVLDGIVFWTKNPAPMLEHLDELRPEYYFQVTITPYGREMEPNIPSKEEAVIPSVLRLIEKAGPERVVWRYDPVILNDRYPLDSHCRQFEKMAKALKGGVRKCTFSFLDPYRNTVRNAKAIGPGKPARPAMLEAARRLSEIAAACGMPLDACAEAIDLSEFGIGRARCVDGAIFEELLGYPLSVEKDKNQRPECGCAASIDIGAYNTCPNGCLYCYANFSPGLVKGNAQRHDPASPLLIGELTSEDRVTERKARSHRDAQTRLF